LNKLLLLFIRVLGLVILVRVKDANWAASLSYFYRAFWRCIFNPPSYLITLEQLIIETGLMFPPFLDPVALRVIKM
jgi:hypothetical protein